MIAVTASACARVHPPGQPGGEGTELASSADAAGSDAAPHADEVSLDGEATSSPSAPPAPSSVVSAVPSATAPATPAPTASASATPPTSPAAKPVTLVVGDPKFTSGEAPKAKAAVEKLRSKIVACVDDHGGLTGDSGEIVVQFLVRMQGIAEGVDIVSARGVGPEAKSCVRDLMKKKSVGAPTSDPTGVEIALQLTPKAAGAPRVK